MAVITLSVDATQAQQALKAVNNAITQAKINGATISIDGKIVNRELNNIGETAKKTGETIQKTTTEAANDATKGIKGVTNVFGKGIGQIRGFINGVVSWWTGLIVAIELATKTFTYFFNNLTQSTTKMTTRGQNAIKIAEQNKKKVQQETKAAQDLISKLEELNKIQNLNYEQMRLAESIADKLNNRYKDLGITLDGTTGKYEGLYEAQRKIDQRNRNVQANSLRQEIAAQRDVVNAALKAAFSENITLDTNVGGNEFFTLAQKLGKTLGAENAQILARKWNTKDIQKQLEVIDQLINGLSSSDAFMKNAPQAREAMQTLVNYKSQLIDLLSVDTKIVDANTRLEQSFKGQRDAIKAVKDQVEELNKTYNSNQRTNSLEELEPEDRANALRGEIEQLEKRNMALDEARKIGQKQYDKAMADSFDDPIHYDWLTDHLKSSQKELKKLQGEYDTLMQKKSKYETWFAARDGKMLNPDEAALSIEYANKLTELTSKLSKKQEQITSQQKIFNALNQQFQNAEIQIQKSTQKVLEVEKGLAEIDKERQQNLNAIQAKEQQIAKIEAEIEEARRKLAEQENKRNVDYSDFVNSLMKKQIEGLNEIVNKKKQNLLLELQLNAEKIRGRKLTEDELNALKSYVDVMSMQDQIKGGLKLNMQTNGVITNDLARKGGWASSVVVDRSVDINRQILNVQRSQVDLMNTLNETMNRSNELLKQFSVIQ